MDKLQLASRGGWNAFVTGRDIGRCPYAIDSDVGMAWCAGWRQAQDEYSQAEDGCPNDDNTR